MNRFDLILDLTPKGDQQQAIEKLTLGVQRGEPSQVLLGVTGSGKTFTMANVIARTGKKSLILAHNKTLAAQLYQEFKFFFPNNAVEYFVSYYDYYQPEAYIARTDTYIEKDLAINDQIDKMRLSATKSLIERDDVIIISSVSCIYGLGAPESYIQMRFFLQVGALYVREELLLRLVEMRYNRVEFDLQRGSFRVRGESVDILPHYEEDIACRLIFFGEELERIDLIDPLTGKKKESVKELTLYPGSHYVTPLETRERAIVAIDAELAERRAYFLEQNRFVEEQRIAERTKLDLEMIRQMGYCKGIENYSRHLSGRSPGAAPPCLLDYFGSDFLLFVDESHQTLPQIRAMHHGDRSRKEALIEFGFRLPSAFDNRPLTFDEFEAKVQQVIYVSATPAAYEVEKSGGEVVSQVIRPTGLLDPLIEIKPAEGQVDEAIGQIQQEKANGGRILVTTLTKKLAEDLAGYLADIGLSAKYLHSDIETLERMQIIKDLRVGKFDVLVGINLLREGLDIPEVTLVLILDGDKMGFLRSETALIQTCGRAARNAKGRVVIFADVMTPAIMRTMQVTKERREIQKAYNQQHGITPTTIRKGPIETISETFFGKESEEKPLQSLEEVERKVKELKKLMLSAAKEHRFEQAASLRDQIRELEKIELI